MIFFNPIHNCLFKQQISTNHIHSYWRCWLRWAGGVALFTAGTVQAADVPCSSFLDGFGSMAQDCSCELIGSPFRISYGILQTTPEQLSFLNRVAGAGSVFDTPEECLSTQVSTSSVPTGSLAECQAANYSGRLSSPADGLYCAKTITNSHNLYSLVQVASGDHDTTFTAAPSVPEITVDLAGTGIPDGTVIGTLDFGTVTHGSTETSTVTITNSGNAGLNIAPLPMLATGTTFTLDTTGFNSPIAMSGGADTFDVNLNTSTAGTFMDTLTFTANDLNEGTYTITVTATVDPAPVVTPPNRTLTVEITGEGTVTSSPGGIDCPTDCENSYASGSLVSVFATPADGWQFDRWGEACLRGPSTTAADLVMTTNRLCTVTFIEIPVVDVDPGIIGFTQSNYTVNETASSVTINVNRSGQADGAASIDYALTADTASAGSDYTDTNGTLTWAEGEMGNKTFDIAITDDSDIEGNESLSLSLGNPTPADLGLATDTATLTILDDDTAPVAQPGQAQFVDILCQPGTVIDGTLLLTVPEDIGELLVNVSRSNGSDGAVSIDFSVMPALANMATLVEDFLLMDGTLNWADQSTDNQSFILSIVDDLVEEPLLESFFIELGNPTNGLISGSPATLSITIIDNDACATGEKGIAIDASDSVIPTLTCFVDLLDGNEQQSPFSLNDTDNHRTEIRIDVGAEHQGQAAEILLLAGYRLPGGLLFNYFHRPGGVWTPNPPGMLPAAIDSLSALPASISVLIHDGPLTGLPGNFEFYVGYLLDDGTVVFNGNSVQHWLVE